MTRISHSPHGPKTTPTAGPRLAHPTRTSYPQSREVNSEAVVARGNLRRRVHIRCTNERLLQRLRRATKFPHDIIVRRHVGSLRCPIVAGGGVQHVGRARRALVARVALSALRRGVEECVGGHVWVFVDVLGEALTGTVGCGRQRRAPVASLLQANIAPRQGRRHVHFHPGGREVLAALHGACPAVVERHELGVAAVDGDTFKQGAGVVGGGPEGEGFCGAAVAE